MIPKRSVELVYDTKLACLAKTSDPRSPLETSVSGRLVLKTSIERGFLISSTAA